MNKRELADRFSSEVDHLLHEAGLTEPKPTAPEYDDLLHLARTLATTDFSRQSRTRHSLRRRLLNRIDQAAVTTAEIPGPVSRIKQLLKPDQIKLGPPTRLFKNKFILASLVIIVSFIALLAPSGLPARQKMIELLAQVLAYLPYERQVAPHVLALRWQFRGEGGIGAAPAAANGLIYAGSNSGQLYALDAQTGLEVWRFTTESSIEFSPGVADGLVYAVSGGDLYALAGDSGREKWHFTEEEQFSTPPIVRAGTVYVGSAEGRLYALDAQTGQEKWQFKAGNAILPYLSATGSTLYVGSQDHYLYALEPASGQEKWRFKAGNWLSTPPVEVAGLVYVGSHDEHLYVLEAGTGQEQRRYDLGQAVRTSATLAEGMIYFGSYDSYLHALDGASGQEKWRFKMGKQTRSSPIVVGGVVYIGSGDGYLYEIDAQTGAELARYGVDSQIYTAPAVLGNTIYFVSGKGELYAVQRTPLPSAQEPAATGLSTPLKTESAGFQFTPAAWYVVGPDQVIRFRGKMIDGAGKPVNGVSVQADNGRFSFLSMPSGPNRWQPQAQDGEWELVISASNPETGWWWLTAVRDDCAAGETNFDPQCQELTRLSESIKIEVVYPDEMVINADWTCQWECQNLGKK